jgi:DNA polymerase kappa
MRAALIVSTPRSRCSATPLKGKAFGVGYGVLCTASYEARKFGCRSGMAGFIARSSARIIFTELHFDLYTAASTKVRDVLKRYDPCLMMAGLDEGISSGCASL